MIRKTVPIQNRFHKKVPKETTNAKKSIEFSTLQPPLIFLDKCRFVFIVITRFFLFIIGITVMMVSPSYFSLILIPFRPRFDILGIRFFFHSAWVHIYCINLSTVCSLLRFFENRMTQKFERKKFLIV